MASSALRPNDSSDTTWSALTETIESDSSVAGLGQYSYAQHNVARSESHLRATSTQPEDVPTPGSPEAWPTWLDETSIFPWVSRFFSRLHATSPILNENLLYRDMAAQRHRRDRQFGAMVLALCAFAIIKPIQDSEISLFSYGKANAESIIQAAVTMHSVWDLGDGVTIETVITSYFLFSCMFGMEKHNAAQHRMSEVTNLACSLGIHTPQFYTGLTTREKHQALCLYLVVSDTQRAYVLCYRRPITFQPIAFQGARSLTACVLGECEPTLPQSRIVSLLKDDPADEVKTASLIYNMEMFEAIDECVTSCWGGNCRMLDGVCSVFDRRRALDVFRALLRAEDFSRTGNLSFTSHQAARSIYDMPASLRADIVVTQIWVLSRIWELSLGHGLLSHHSEFPPFRLSFAFDMARHLLAEVGAFDMCALEVHGLGIVLKIQNVATSVLHAIKRAGIEHSDLDPPLGGEEEEYPLSPFRSPATRSYVESMSARDVVRQLHRVLGTFRGGHHPFLIEFNSNLETHFPDLLGDA